MDTFVAKLTTFGGSARRVRYAVVRAPGRAEALVAFRAVERVGSVQLVDAKLDPVWLSTTRLREGVVIDDAKVTDVAEG